MKGKISLLTRKIFASIIAVAMSIPPTAFANTNQPVVYDANSSVMGLAETKDVENPQVANDDETKVAKDLGDYYLEISSKLDPSLTKIDYTIKAKRKEKLDKESQTNLSLTLTKTPASNINNIKLVSASTETKTNDPDFKEELDGLVITSKANDEIIYELSADVNEAKDQRAYELIVGIKEDDKEAKIFAYNLEAKTAITLQDNNEVEVINLVSKEEKLTKAKGEYKKEGIFGGIFTSRDTITWTDYIVNEKEEVTYDFNLDQNQDITNSQIILDYYEQTENGFEIKKEFSQKIDYSNKIKFEIPQGYIAKITLKTEVDKKNTAIKSYSLNNIVVKNPIYIEGNEKNNTDDEEDPASEDKKVEEKTDNKEETSDTITVKDKTTQEEKTEGENPSEENKDGKTSDTQIVVTDGSNEEIPVVEKDNPDQKDTKPQISAIILNKDSLIGNLKTEGKLTNNLETAITDLASYLDSYNEEKITDQELKDFTKALADRNNIEKSGLRYYLESILSGLNKQNNKAANLNYDEIITYAYPEKKETEIKVDDQEAEKPQETKETKENTSKENPTEKSSPEIKVDDKVKEEKAKANQKEAVKEFDADLAKLKEEAAKNPEEKGVFEGLKSLIGQTDLQKADKELKKALADETKSLEEIQNLLNSFKEKYNLSKADQAKLMDDNGDAIKKLIEKDADENFRPSMLFDNGSETPQPVGAGSSELNLDGKKFTIMTRFDASVANGTIPTTQSFTINLDDRLKVNDPSTLKPIIDKNGSVIARPTYDSNTNSIKYNLAQPITENIQVPLAIDVDYNVEKIKALDKDATIHSIKNSISGIGVTGTVKLPETVVDNNGNVVNQIIEPGSKDILEIVDQGKDYKVYMDVKGSPVVENGKLEAIDWQVKFSSNVDLKELGLVSNATLVKGSGLKDFESILLNGNPVQAGDLSDNSIEGQLGIVKSKNHTLTFNTKEVKFNFRTPVEDEPQAKYVIDLSVALQNRNKTGAVRLLFDQGFDEEAIEESTSKRVGMNNRTTILGEFASENTARWTVTDGVSTGDTISGFPLATRELAGDQKLTSSKVAVYGLDPKTCKMVVKQDVTDLNKTIPSAGTNPQGEQLPGRIAVYEFNTSINGSKQGYSLAGVNINKYQDLKIKQTWAGITSDKNMPAQEFYIKDQGGNILKSITVEEGQAGVSDRKINVPEVKYWNIDENGKETKIVRKVVQKLPKDKYINGTYYSYKEKYNNYALEDKSFQIYNIMEESTNEKEADFTILKTDSKNNTPLAWAKFTLQSPTETIELVTDSYGRANFSNVSPGTYTLIENKAPAGYKIDQSAKQIVVSNTGSVSVSGDNIVASGGKIDTETAHHQYYPLYKSYMNSMHYGNIDKNGNIVAYIYLKPESNDGGNGTNKNTRLNLNLNGGTISNVEVIDVAPDGTTEYNTRSEVFSAMQNQTASSVLGSDVQNKNVANDITGKDNVKDDFTGKTGYQIKFPTARFNNDWGFLVKVTGKKSAGTTTPTFSYDWLTDNTSVNNEARIQTSVGLSNKSSTNTSGETEPIILTIKNEAFPKAKVQVTKVKEDKTVLANATFILKDSNGRDVKTVLADANGLADFGELSPGDYTIVESIAPKNYKKSNVIFDVNVTEDGKVTYKARFKDGNGTPINGIDYILEDTEINQEAQKVKVENVKQYMILQEKQSQPADGRLGTEEGIWEAYGIESYRYKSTFTISNAQKGQRFKIQFDPHLDFKRYVYEMPKLKDGSGKVIADPYFNYETNLLTYVFTDDVKNTVNAQVEIIGIIPDKFYATQTDKTNGYNFTITVDPDDPNASTANNKVLPVNIKTDYYGYDYQGGGGPQTSEYITDVYKGADGNIYLKAVSYYNPTNMTSGPRKLRYDWLSMNRPQPPSIEYYRANGYPAFGIDDIKVYKVYGNQSEKQRLMPLSYGIRPEQDPNNYNLVYSKSGINASYQGFSDYDGTYRVEYKPENLKNTQRLIESGHDGHPLEISIPGVKSNEGYVVIQTFKVTDEQRFKNLWSGYYFSQGSRHTASYQKGNYNWAIGSETGQEIPKFYTQRVKLINKTYTPGSFKIKKTDETNNNNLKGAVFELRNQAGDVIYRPSDEEGIVEFNDLEPGRYILKENKAPDGYTMSDKTWQVVVYDSGIVSITEIALGETEEPLTGNKITLPVTNKPSGTDFIVYKKDSDGETLQGAKFKITKQDDTTFKAVEKTSDVNGIVKFGSLTKGTYVIEETEAPAGYNKANKKWVLVIDDKGNKKVYNYRESSGTTPTFDSILEQPNVNWVNVAGRSLDGWNLYDNRRTDWTGNFPTPYKMGTRIVGINRDEKYVIQRFVINPEANNLGPTTATIHREKPEYQNMDWYEGDEDYQVFKLDKPITGSISDIRRAEYNPTNITTQVRPDTDKTHSGQPPRLKLDFPATTKPIVVDIKVPYKYEDGGVGLGMDWTENGTTYWKSDYYEKASIIKEADPVLSQSTGIIGSLVSENSLDVTNDILTYGFKLKKVKNTDENIVIEGATFKLKGPGDSGKEITKTTGSDGTISFDGLKPGTYTMTETSPAPGYEKPDTTWTVTVTKEGKVYYKANDTDATNASAIVETPESLALRAKSNILNRLQASPYTSDNLEFGENIISNPLRAGDGWEDVDLSKSQGQFYTKGVENQQKIQTRITKINKSEGKLRQVFLVNKMGDGMNESTFDFHPEPFNTSLIGEGLKKPATLGINFKIISIRPVSTNSNLLGNDGYTLNYDGNITYGYKDAQNYLDKTKNKYRYSVKLNGGSASPLAIEVEYDYPESGGIGLGMDYKATYNSQSAWAAQNFIDVKYINIDKVEKVTVTFNENGGSGSMAQAQVDKGTEYTLPQNKFTPPTGKEFKAWEVGGVEKAVGDKVTINGDTTVKAIWQNEQIIISFDGNGGTYNKTPEKVDKGSLYTIPGNPFIAPTGKEFKGWNLNGATKQPGDQITVDNNLTLIAMWGDPAPTEVTITLSPGDGSGQMTTQKVTPGSSYTLPAANIFTPPSGKKFAGWLVGSKLMQAGEQITVGADTTITAQWRDYEISVALDIQNGSVTASPANAQAGQKVTLTVKPNPGFEIASVSMNGTALTATNGVYTFTMPDSDVNVTATFKEVELGTEIPKNGFAQITNEQTGLELKIAKKDNNARPLEGAEFTIQKDGEEAILATATSDKYGNVVFEDKYKNPIKLTKGGKYTLTETKAPIGFKKAAAPWHIVVEEVNGQLVIKKSGPEATSSSFLTSEKAVAANNLSGKIKYKSIVKSIDTTSKTFVQRLYVDTRNYGRTVNLQIKPEHKREEIDRPGLPPVTITEGVKTAYRSTYKVTNPGENIDVDEVLNQYDLRQSNVSVVNTARWRPFDWGFDEDILNLEPGVYFIDIEGYYDQSIVDRKVTNEVAIDSNYNFTKKDGRTPSTEPVIKDPYERTDIPQEDLGKIELHFDFYDGAREFRQLYDKGDASVGYKYKDKGSYQGGMIELRNWIARYNGTTKADNWSNKKPASQKYKNALSKEAYVGTDTLAAGIIYPSVTGTPAAHVDTSLDISSLYTSDKLETIPQEGMSVTNDKEVYNITFSKHKKGGDDNTNRLEGAVFKLQKKEGSFWNDLDDSYVSSAFNGYFGFRRLEPGSYRLIEVSPPKGYRAIDGTLLEFKINTFDPHGETYIVTAADGTKKTYDKKSGLQVEVRQDGTNKVIDPKTGKIIENANGYVTIDSKQDSFLKPNVVNSDATKALVDFVTSATAKNIGKVINEEPGEGKVTITKYGDDTTKLLPGVEFEATKLSPEKDKDGKPISTATFTGKTDSNGVAIIEGLPIGNYELREKNSVSGHINTGQVWHFTVGGEGLDPYANDNSSGGRNLSGYISITESDIKVVKPQQNNIEVDTNQIFPHSGETFKIENNYNVDPSIRISSGDYFVLKLTDNIDLEGIRRGDQDNLDLFADGVGTIAKAKYNKEAGTITYTFTKYADQYKLLDFSNTFSAHPTLDRVKKSSWQNIGTSVGDKGKYKDIYFYYIVDNEVDYDDYNNYISMASKIVSFNSETGEFVHYFYINRPGYTANRNLTFRYQPSADVKDLKFTKYVLSNNSDDYLYDSMPASFGVDENDYNLADAGTTSFGKVYANEKKAEYIGQFPSNKSMIIKVTGKIDTNNLMEYKGYSALYYRYQANGYWYTNPAVYRWDGIYAFSNDSTAKAELSITATNPTNKIQFKKVDESGKILTGAEFSLYKNDGTIEQPKQTWTAIGDPRETDTNGLISYEELEEGLYELRETKAPDNYSKPTEPVAIFKVDENGRIFREVTVNKADGSGTEKTYQEVDGNIPINIINYKSIQFVKIDGANKDIYLQGALFEVWKKEKPKDANYKPYKVKDSDGKDITLTVTSEENGKFSLSITEDGEYALKEIKAPKGYTKVPGYIKEFKLENGKIQVLEKSSKQGTVQTDNNIISSQTIEINEKDKTFKQRIVLNPNQKEWHFDGGDTQLRLYEAQWTVNTTGKKIRYAVLDENKSISDLKEGDFKEFNPRNSSAKPLMYAVARMYGENNYTKPSSTSSGIYTNKSLVVEFIGKLTDSATSPINIKMDVNSDQWKYSELTYSLDYDKIIKEDKIYVDYESNKGPIKVENTKAVYPLTASVGTAIFTAIGLALMVIAAFICKRKKVEA